MLEGMTLEAGWALLKRFWYTIPMIGLAIALALTSHNLSNARKALGEERDFRTAVQTVLHSKKNDRSVLLADIRSLVQAASARKDALDDISREALAEKQKSDAKDAALKLEQQTNARKYAEAQKTIDQLQHRKPTGNAAADCAAIEEDSQAPWKAWK